jgi:glucosylceramidase
LYLRPEVGSNFNVQKNTKKIHERLMRILLILCLTVVFIGAQCKEDDPVTPVVPNPDPIQSDVQMWVTRPDRSALLAKQSQALRFGSVSLADPVIEVDTTQVFQPMEGFGFTMTGASAQVLNRDLDATRRAQVLRELFSNDSLAIKISYLRISIGASDLSATTYTYADQNDPSLSTFSIAAEKTDMIPILREVLALRPDLKIIATPWTAPIWMKNNGNWVGGSLLDEYQDEYAQYFVRYIQAMAAEGIQITAITPQNEPENPFNNPSMTMTAEAQRDFIKNHLGPAFAAAGIATKIIVFDHNCDNPNYPLTILNDPAARAYVAGSAFHLYAGDISAIGQVQQAYPDKVTYFTEQFVSSTGQFGGDLAWHTRNLMTGAVRQGVRVVLEWNLATNANYGPFTPGGCDQCLGALTVANNNVQRNTSYYIIAHTSRWVPPGSVRVGSTAVSGLPNVAYRTPQGNKVLVVLNDGGTDRRFNVLAGGRAVQPIIPAGSVATFVW